MRNAKTLKSMFLCGMVLVIAIPTTVSAKALRSPVQTGDDIIIAKGDIPTPEKYHSAITNYLSYTTEQLGKMVSQLETLNKSLKKRRPQNR